VHTKIKCFTVYSVFIFSLFCVIFDKNKHVHASIYVLYERFVVCEQQMAVEMVLTLGQAFEVAYQLAVKNGVSDTNDVACVNNTNSHTPPQTATKTSHATTPTATDQVWRPPVNLVKPLRIPVVTNSSNVTVGLH